MQTLEEELEEAVRRLVDEPDAVEVEEVEDEDGSRFEVRVAPDDLGKVIGRQGRTVRALRTLLETRGERDGFRYWIDILED
ncbi:MAG: KH domain-containing protein [Thermoanaerobaculia bacterium]|nr:KH domain-containing protein [Thermoanaerobaculia bacterium]